MSEMRSPILVTGGHRSGTTWVGKMLCAGGEAHYIHEPFNAGRRDYDNGPGCIPRCFPYWFYHIPPFSEASIYEGLVKEVVELRYPLFDAISRIRKPRHVGRIARDYALTTKAHIQNKRPLIKDPIALFSAEWLAERFDMRVVVMIRHPLGFASSLKRLNWRFDFTNWLNQDLLMQKYLSPFREQIVDYSRNKKDIIEQAILMWNVMYSVVHQYQQNHPDWLFVKHEELAVDPIEGFKELYRYCELCWNSNVESVVLSHSKNGNVGEVPQGNPGTIKRDSKAAIATWEKRLTQREIWRVSSGTREVARLFYAKD
jgi:hypothetical protein